MANMAEQSQRRRFQFRLRTLFVLTTILCVCGAWFSWQVRIVNERKSLLQSLETSGAHVWPQREGYWAHETNFVRRMLGDIDVLAVTSGKNPLSAAEIEKIKEVFPVAGVDLQSTH